MSAGAVTAAPAPAEPVLLRAHPAFDLLTVPFLLLVFALPARLIFPPLGGAGRPAVLFAAGLGLLWFLGVLQRRTSPSARQPVRWLTGVYLAVQLVTYAAGFDRGLPGHEANSADRWLITSVAVCGLAVFVADAVPDRAALDRLLRRMVLGGCFMAFVGSLQFLLGIDLTRHIRVPGLAPSRALIGIGERGDGFSRVAGTATHYIEYGVVIAMVIPIAVHLALFAPPGRQRRTWWAAVVLLGSALPFSVSRSGVLALLVAVVVLGSVWPWRLRLNALAVVGVSVVAYRLLQPGLLGTIKSLFLNAEDDPSVQNRTEDYATVFAYLDERPWLGRGAGTFMPDHYILLDNQYLLTLASQGFVGLAALLVLLLGAYWTARSTRLRGPDEETRHLGQALAAAVMTGLVASFTFDSLGFTGFRCLLFLLIGCVGALVRLARPWERELQPSSEHDTRVATPWMIGSGRGAVPERGSVAAR